MRRLTAAGILMSMALPSVGYSYEPRVNYQLQCMGCHLANGTGESGRVPSVRRTLVPFSMISEGREFVLRVPGVAQSPLTDGEIAAVLNWMARNLSDTPLPAAFKDYDAGEVRALRERPLAQVTETRAKLLERVRDSCRGGCLQHQRGRHWPQSVNDASRIAPDPRGDDWAVVDSTAAHGRPL